MYWFLLRPKWIAFHLLVLFGIVVMINLGMWQLRRLDERREFNAAVEARYDEPSVALDRLLVPGLADEQLNDLEWTPVTVTGEYLPDETVRIVNRSQNGRAGDNIVVPLMLADGSAVLVNRGFVPLPGSAPEPPAGAVTVMGRLRPSQDRRLGQLSDPETGDLTEMQRVHIERLQQQIDVPLEPMYIDAFASDPADSSGLEPVAKPDLSEGSHQSYAFQWFIFSVCVAVGWVLAVRRSISTRKRKLAAEQLTGAHAGTRALDELIDQHADQERSQ